jgi:hypothetical protein
LVAELQKVVGPGELPGQPTPGGEGEPQIRADLKVNWIGLNLISVEGNTPAPRVHLVLVQGNRELSEADVEAKEGWLATRLYVPENAGTGLAVLVTNRADGKGLGRFEVPARAATGGTPGTPKPEPRTDEGSQLRASLSIGWASARSLKVGGSVPDSVSNFRLMLVNSTGRVLSETALTASSGRFYAEVAVPENAGSGLAILVVDSKANRGLGRFEVPNR